MCITDYKVLSEKPRRILHGGHMHMHRRDQERPLRAGHATTKRTSHPSPLLPLPSKAMPSMRSLPHPSPPSRARPSHSLPRAYMRFCKALSRRTAGFATGRIRYASAAGGVRGRRGEGNMKVFLEAGGLGRPAVPDDCDTSGIKCTGSAV